jgi:DENN domain-containing protein 5
MSIIA